MKNRGYISLIIIFLILNLPVIQFGEKILDASFHQKNDALDIKDEQYHGHSLNSTLLEKIENAINWLNNYSTVPNSDLEISGYVSYINSNFSESNNYTNSVLNKLFIVINLDQEITINNELHYTNSENNVFGLTFFKKNISSSFYIQYEGSKFTYNLGDEFLPIRYDWYIKEIKDQNITISYSNRFSLVEFIYSMVKIYTLTKNQAYLELAKPITRALINLQNEDGHFIRNLAHESEPSIIGMYNAICMYGLYNYFLISGDQYVYESIFKAANVFYHSSEGTTNHLVNSVFGLILSKFILGIYNDFSYEEAEINYLLGLYNEDGRISYSLPGSGKDYPYYKPTYWSYDSRVFMRNAQFLITNEIYSKIFPTTFENAVNTTNTDLYKKTNLLTLYKAHSLGLCGEDERFNLWSNEFIQDINNNSFICTKHALDYILVISLMLSNNLKLPFLLGLSNSGVVITRNEKDLDFDLDMKIRIAKFENQDFFIKLKFSNNEQFFFEKVYQITNSSNQLDIYEVSHEIDIIPQNLSYKLLLISGNGSIFYETEWLRMDYFIFYNIDISYLFYIVLVISLVYIVLLIRFSIKNKLLKINNKIRYISK